MASSPDTIISEIINAFYGGISADRGIQQLETFGISQHFDTFSSPQKMTPYRAMEEDQNTSYEIIKVLYANSNVFGFGVVSGSGKVEVYKKNSDPITGSWAQMTHGADAGGARFKNCFLSFHNYAYGGAAGTRIWACDLTDVAAFTSTAYSGAGEPVCNGIVTTDDFLIIPCASGIARKDGAGSGPTSNWSTFSIVPSSHTPVDICEIGDIVAIFAKPASGSLGVNSKIFLWDKVSQDPSQVIDLGNGDVVIGDEIEGELVAVIQVGGGTTFSIDPKLVVRSWSGGSKAQVAIEIPADSGTSTLSILGNHTKVKDGNKVIFGLSITLDGASYTQLATLGRKTPVYPLALTLDRLVDNDTALTGSIQGVGKAGDYIWVGHNGDGSLNRTNDQAVYTNATAVYISQKVNGETRVRDAARRKKVLKSAGILCEKLTSGQSVSLYYRTDGATSWTLIRTYAYGDDALESPAIVPGNVGFEAGVADVNGDGTSLLDFVNYHECQFKATATGGAEIMGIPYSWQFAGSEVSSV